MIQSEVLDKIPRHVGVYIMKNASGQVLYVGKAQNLNSRVRSYFRKNPDNRPQVPFLTKNAVDIECILTNTEKEALLLEDSLIKKHRPRYNIMLRDDKSFLSIKIDLREKFPGLKTVRFREVKDDKSRYFGPYSSARAVRETLQLIQRIFPVRSCSRAKFSRHKTRPCLECQINRCLGPCCQNVSEQEYRKVINAVILFLDGKNTQLLEQLREKMQQESEQLQFEEAGHILNQIRAVEHVTEAQQTVSTRHVNQDVLGLWREADEVMLQIMHIRAGALTENTVESFSRVRIPDDEVISSYLTQFYLRGAYIPDEILLPVEIPERDAIVELLGERKGKKVQLNIPRRGAKKRLVDMAGKNAHNSFAARKDEAAIRLNNINRMQQKLRLLRCPEKIECFDISNIQGTSAVASMVVFVDGQSEKSLYRRYRIKSISRPDDYSMMQEVLTRRYTRAVAEKDLPDLVIVDGGKGQLNIALKILSDLGLKHLDVISIAKDKSDWDPEKRKLEKIYLAGVKDPVILKPNSPVLFLIQQIRDEAHRFAIAYHKKLRKKRGLRSVLDEIPGIGPRRKQALLKHFGSFKKLSEATVESIEAVPGISHSLAETLHKSLKR